MPNRDWPNEAEVRRYSIWLIMWILIEFGIITWIFAFI
jgi:hypothetical protein